MEKVAQIFIFSDTSQKHFSTYTPFHNYSWIHKHLLSSPLFATVSEVLSLCYLPSVQRKTVQHACTWYSQNKTMLMQLVLPGFTNVGVPFYFSLYLFDLIRSIISSIKFRIISSSSPYLLRIEWIHIYLQIFPVGLYKFRKIYLLCIVNFAKGFSVSATWESKLLQVMLKI